MTAAPRLRHDMDRKKTLWFQRSRGVSSSKGGHNRLPAERARYECKVSSSGCVASHVRRRLKNEALMQRMRNVPVCRGWRNPKEAMIRRKRLDTMRERMRSRAF